MKHLRSNARQRCIIATLIYKGMFAWTFFGKIAKPVLSTNTIFRGLFHLVTEPNHKDPTNHDVAAVLRDNPNLFESNVRRAMAGVYVDLVQLQCSIELQAGAKL